MNFFLVGKILLFFASGADAAGCRGGYKYNANTNPCDLTALTCNKEACTKMIGEWTDECPNPEPKCEANILAASSDDPKCTGPPEAIDRLGKKMYKRKLISRHTYGTQEEGLFCHVTFRLCENENAVTQQIDHGWGDHARIQAYNPDGSSWCDAQELDGIKFAGMNKCNKARSYSPVTPLNENTVQLQIKEARSNEQKNNCKHGKNCTFGMSELVCHAPVGTEFLLAAVTDHGGSQATTHLVSKPNFSMKPGQGPYTINFIGQGVALTEINIAVLSMLGTRTASDGTSPSPIKKINYLWANRKWSNSEWILGGPSPAKSEFAEGSRPTIPQTFGDTTDLSREMVRQAMSWGDRFNLMHSISGETVPEAAWGRINSAVIGQAFGLTKTEFGSQDPNIKWFVVGTGGFKAAMYPLIKEWGFDLAPCNVKAESKGYPVCGPNALYEQEPPGALGLEGRPRSYLFKQAQDFVKVNMEKPKKDKLSEVI
jgi:hypothetical protein